MLSDPFLTNEHHADSFLRVTHVKKYLLLRISVYDHSQTYDAKSIVFGRKLVFDIVSS